MRGIIRTWSMLGLLTSLALCLPAWGETSWDALRQGGVLILMRHSATEPGIGDPPGFQRELCSTQRNLSADGQIEARRLGAMLESNGVRPVAVFSSVWCRCMDTARLAFPSVPVKHLAALDSVFMDDSQEPAQTAQLREAIGGIDASGVTVWVTHQVNASALTGVYLGVGEALVLRPQGAGKFRIIGRLGLPQG